MPGTYYEKSELKNIPDVILVVRHHQLETKLQKAIGYVDRQMLATMYQLYDDYTEEIDRRVYDDEIDIDETEEIIYSKELYNDDKFEQYLKDINYGK